MNDKTEEVSDAIQEFARDHKEELDQPDWLMRLNAFLEKRGLPPKEVPKDYWSREKKRKD